MQGAKHQSSNTGTQACRHTGRHNVVARTHYRRAKHNAHTGASRHAFIQPNPHPPTYTHTHVQAGVQAYNTINTVTCLHPANLTHSKACKRADMHAHIQQPRKLYRHTHTYTNQYKHTHTRRWNLRADAGINKQIQTLIHLHWHAYGHTVCHTGASYNTRPGTTRPDKT